MVKYKEKKYINYISIFYIHWVMGTIVLSSETRCFEKCLSLFLFNHTMEVNGSKNVIKISFQKDKQAGLEQREGEKIE